MKQARASALHRSRRAYWGSVFLLLLIASLLSLGAYLFSPTWFVTAGAMPVALHSPLRADYSADLTALRPAALGLALVGEAARDLAARAADPLPELSILLQTPVPTATPFGPGLSPTDRPLPTGTAAPTAQEPTVPFTPTWTATRFTPTFTPTPTPSATASRTPDGTSTRPTRTAVIASPTPTLTPPPPTATSPAAPTRTPTSAPATPTPQPTSYPPPATGYPGYP